jgi:catechol 2,3-dioxygenase-like lactoylglutathione lyase family enzyme
MASLRHIAVCVKDLDKSAAFYETVFGMHEVGRETIEIGSAIYLSDGTVNLALLNFSGKRGNTFDDPAGQVGANHFGFQVDDAVETRRQIEALGGSFFFSLGDERKGNFEIKFKDPDGVVFDISEHGWLGTNTRREPES